MPDISPDSLLLTTDKSKPDIVVCPYCGTELNKKLICFNEYYLPPIGEVCHRHSDKQVCFTFFVCASCGKESISAHRSAYRPFSAMIYPRCASVELPDYIPEAIKSDYLEACTIRDLSPKSAAALCRRCLQGMIHDFWGIHEKNLNAELSTLKSHISPRSWQAIDSLRQIGNIGAHMEHDVNLIVDIDPEEADVLIRLIEYLFYDWYISRHESNNLFDSINLLNQEYQNRRRR